MPSLRHAVSAVSAVSAVPSAAAAALAGALIIGPAATGAATASAAPLLNAFPAQPVAASPASSAAAAVVARPLPAPRRMVSAWLPYWRGTAALGSVTTNADLYTDASPFWFQLTAAGALTPLSRSVSERRVAATVRSLHARGLPVLPTVVERLRAPQMAAFLASPANRARHVRDLVRLATVRGFDGVDLDYEAMNYGGTAATRALVRSRFALLAGELAAALHARGKSLSITVGARDSDDDPDWSVYDYARLGRIADRFRVMTYDYGWKGSAPRAVAPLWWVDRVMRYTVSRVPAGKVWVGVPTYGYDWPLPASGPRPRADAVSYREALALQRQHSARRRWQATVASDQPDGAPRPVAAPYFRYTRSFGRAKVPHVTYYNDAASARALVALVGRYRLAGAVFWSVGDEDPGTWPAVRAYARSIARTPTRVFAAILPSTRYAGGVRLAVAVRVAGRRTPVGGATLAAQVRAPGGRAGWRTIAVTSSDAAGQRIVPLRAAAGGRAFRVVVQPTWGTHGAVSTVVTR